MEKNGNTSNLLAEQVKQELLSLIMEGMLPTRREQEKANALFKVCKEYASQREEMEFNAGRLAKIFEKDMPPVYENFEEYKKLNHLK